MRLSAREVRETAAVPSKGLEDKMVKIAVVCSLLFCVLGLGTFGAPELAVDMATFAFADTVEGLSVAHTFILTNTGDEDTIITSVAPTCGCTRIVAELKEYRLAPGQSANLVARLDTAWSSGFVSKKLVVKSNAPGTDGDYALQLYFEGIVNERPPHQSSVADLRGDIYLLIDVREPDAYAAGHFVGSVCMPAGQLATLARTIPPTALVVIYDEAGAASVLDKAAEALCGAGIPSVYALSGGLSQWRELFGEARMAYGTDASWGAFLDVSGSGPSSQSIGALPYYPGQLLTDPILVDLRSPEEYDVGHLAGAVNLAETEVSAFVAALRDGMPVVIYSSDGVAGDQLAQHLRAQGWPVTSLLGGFAEWKRQYGNLLVIASAS